MSDIKYVLNDPTTPTLIINVAPPSPPNGMPFTVMGYVGGGHEPNTVEGQAANDYVTITTGINLIQTYCPKPLQKWPATNNLRVIPRAGQDLNAYYDRQNLKFFFMPDKKLGKVVYVADSLDVVAHELGHGLLDTARPDLWNAQALETMAFHEAYGDINAILVSLSHQEVINYVLKETNNDLRKSNVVSRLAEELGTALYDLAGVKTKNALRNAINNFKYTPPEQLSQTLPDDQLSGEPHSFGRLFVGAWYDILVGIYELEYKSNKDASKSLNTAREIAGKYVWQGIANAPLTSKFYSAVAKAMLVYAKSQNPAYAQIISNVFTSRNILSGIKMLSTKNIKDVKGHAKQIGTNKVIITKHTHKLILSHHLGIVAQENIPVFSAEIEVPQDSYYEFDENGILVDELETSLEEATESAKQSLLYLHNNKKVCGDDYDNDSENATFELKEGKLKRTKFQCKCGDC